MQCEIEELRRKAEQGSPQLQGEVQELELESMLGSAFVYDTIARVPKGEFGGDVLQRVVMNQTDAGLADEGAGSSASHVNTIQLADRCTPNRDIWPEPMETETHEELER